jgi:2-dehydropantoate 2-reductase
MTILVVGAGATGGFFGQRLALAGRDVTFLVRPRRAEVLRARGLRVVGLGRDERIEPKLVTAGEIDHPYDVVLLTVKATALQQALDDLAPAVGPRTRIVPFLNGMAHLDELTRRFGAEAVLGGVVLLVTQLDPDGDIQQLAPMTGLEIGRLDGDVADAAVDVTDAADGAADGRLAEVAAELGDAGFDFSVSEDMLGAMWAKWVMIATIGALTCLLRAPVGDIVASPGGADVARAIVAEAASVAASAGHPVPDQRLDGIVGLVTEQGSTFASSMYRDMNEGAATEVEQILGDLARRAHEAGLATPLLDLATLHLRVYEHRRTKAA